MRIIYLGINTIGKQIYDWLIEQGENVISLITTPDELDAIRMLKPDLIISGGFRHIIPRDILSIPSKGCINFHKAMLPYNRGANPNFWTIVDGTSAGVTIHFMDQGIDTGPILAQKIVETSFADTAKTLYEKLEIAQFELFLDFWPKFKRGEIKPISQTTKGTFHNISDFKELREIHPETTYKAIDLLNLLRAMTFPPFKNCYINLDGKLYFIELRIAEGSINAETRDERGILRQYGE